MIEIPEILEQLLQSDIFKMVAAFLLILPVAYNREHSTRIMGLRTFPLVAIATCSYILISMTFIGPASVDAQSRIVQGLVAGIGFIGGGAILKQEDRVLGTASAASIWSSGAVGIAVAYARYDLAIFLALANFLILHWLTPMKSTPSDKE
jgi:putative Mg2+ transporter-C (MgtC) family protein